MTPLDFLLIGVALLLGWTLSKASLCVVACTKRFVVERDAAAMNVLGLAISASGLVLLGLALWIPGSVMLPTNSQPYLWSAVGGVVFGIGSLVNGGCYLGSVTYLGSGNSNYLFTLLGIAISLRVTPGTMHIPMAAAAMPGQSRLLWTLFALLFAAFIAFALWRENESEQFRSLTLRGAWPTGIAVCLSGLLGACLYARSPDWSYGSVLDDLAHLDQRPWSASANVAALSLFAGAVLGTWLSGHWKPIRPQALHAFRCLVGGMLMAFGGKLIPGGSDMLILWSVPGLAGYGALALLAMLATIGGAFFAMRFRPAARVR